METPEFDCFETIPDSLINDVYLDFDIYDDTDKRLNIIIEQAKNDQTITTTCNFAGLLAKYRANKFDNNEDLNIETLQSEIIPELEDVRDLLKGMVEDIEETIASAEAYVSENE